MSAMPVPDTATRSAYEYCVRLARGHYENFPVASILLPARLRPHVAAVYAFARHADDMADEGNDPPTLRRANIEDWRAQLRRVEARQSRPSGSVGAATGTADDAPLHPTDHAPLHPADDAPLHPVFIALGDTIERFGIPGQLLHDLLDAFVQDTHTERYATFDEVLDYCTRSANPVGRILLALFGILDERRATAADALCTGLQLVNFWQDISIDRRKPRVYLPLEDLVRFAVPIEDILHGTDTPATRRVIAFEIERTRRFFHAALPLFPLVPLRLRLELRAIWRGGMKVLEKIEKQHYTVVQSRPALSATDMLSVIAAAVLKGMPDAGS